MKDICEQPEISSIHNLSRCNPQIRLTVKKSHDIDGINGRTAMNSVAIGDSPFMLDITSQSHVYCFQYRPSLKIQLVGAQLQTFSQGICCS